MWSDINDPLPDIFLEFSLTWKENHPDWKYEFWDNDRMNNFVVTHYPEYWDAYNRYPYNVQRWDAIRRRKIICLSDSRQVSYPIRCDASSATKNGSRK